MTKEFTNKLRAAAKALANGDLPEIVIPHKAVAFVLAGKKSSDNPTAYIRNTMSRVSEVKAVGSISVKKSMCNDDESDHFGDDVYTVTINRETRKTVYSKKDVERIKAATASKTAARIMKISPNLANYAPDEYATIAKVIEEIQEQIKSQFINDNEE